MMEKGVGAENKGKTLNEIDLEIENWNDEHDGEEKNLLEINESMKQESNNYQQLRDQKFPDKYLDSSRKSNISSFIFINSLIFFGFQRSIIKRAVNP